MLASAFESIGKRAPILRLRTRTPLKLGKAGRPSEWKDAVMEKEQVIKVRVNFFRCPIVGKRLEEQNLGPASERFLVPAWGERVAGLPLIRHTKTGELYLWCLGEGVESCQIQANGQDITNDLRLHSLMGRDPSKEVTNGMVSFVLRLDSIEEMEEVAK